MSINVTLFLLLYERDIGLCYAPGIVHTLGELYSLLIVEFLLSICRLLRLILVLGCARLKALEELEGAHSDALIVQGKLGVVHYRDQFRLVILVVAYKGV